ncbi:MAG: hypothetical protein LBT55_07755 [Clostridiaceae bacterium]|jgi:dsRNA-specific ribonuclease|nr:hypothetical protein [Clostridiaceae bacterium]
MEEIKIKEIENIIGYVFKNKALLVRAFTHNSYANQFKKESYQLLEFLGDSIVGFIIAEYFVKRSISQKCCGRHKTSEGDCSKRKSSVVSNPSLARVIKDAGLNGYLLLGGGETKDGVNQNESVCSDLFEAIAAAVYLDASDGVQGCAHTAATTDPNHAKTNAAQTAYEKSNSIGTAAPKTTDSQTDEAQKNSTDTQTTGTDADDCIYNIVSSADGISAARAFVLKFLGSSVSVVSGEKPNKDDKTALNEFAAKRSSAVKYECVRNDGPDHEKEFEYRVLLDGQEKGRGCGKTKKEAEQNAARTALDGLD